MACLCGTWLLAGCKSAGEASRPNFVLIQLDDLGWDDLALHGNPYLRTPQLDALGRGAVRFDDFYVNPVCAPTRASLLTGRHFLRTGVSHVHGGKDYLDLGERTLGDLLGEAGYVTGMWGKWHSGHGPGYEPWERGFDEAYMAQLYKHRDPQGVLNGTPVAFPGRWSSEVIVDYALGFMQRHRDSSFLAYLSFLTCHAPLDAPDSSIAVYTRQGLSPKLATLYGMIDLLDQQIGRLMAGLDEMGLAGRTVVIFLSDNGPAVNNGDLSEADRAMRYVSGYLGHKGNLWENGVKSPLFIRWPGVLAPGVRTQLADVTDLLPTLLDMAGVALPPGHRPLDGRSLWPVLQDSTQQRPGKQTFDYANPGWPPTDQPWTPQGIKDEYRPLSPADKAALDYEQQILSVRDDSFKLMLNAAAYAQTPPPIRNRVLVDLRTDPKERRNVLTVYPDQARRLEADLVRWVGEIKASPISFGSPLFTLRDSVLRIPVKGAFALDSGLKKTSNWVEGWDRPGEALYVQLQVDTPGRYVAQVRVLPPGGDVRTWSLQVGTQAVVLSGETLASPEAMDLASGPQTLSLRWQGIVPQPELRVSEVILQRK
ncbi:MAG: sulfatase-like hydrolase/transferase [Bacteroidia bacterium]